MKFLISKNELTQLVGAIQNIVPLKPTLPILSNLLIEATNNKIILTATDLTIGMRCFCETTILEEGSVAIPARKLFQLVRELPNINLEISSHPNEIIEIKAGKSFFRLNGMRKENFPSLPDLNEAIRLKIPQKTLKELLLKTLFAVAKESSHLLLTGVYLAIAEGIASFIGTDGKKLAKATGPISSDQNFTGTAVIPNKAIDEIIKVLTDEGEADIYLMSDKMALKTHQSMLITKLLDGDYPDFQRIFPKNPTISLPLHREELMSCLRQICLFTNEASQSAQFSFAKGKLTISANLSEVGGGKTSIPINYSEGPLDIAFHPGFFLEILKHCKNETVILYLLDSYNPGWITDSSNALFIIMPMRLLDQ